ncbi:hypothetical protein B0H14DRAFT_3129581 [Mycena olivaceomarginata]|nr:hypothetical protein B0H14DRAFT_3129581 [Mycena olivaceomarginata]
MAGPDNYPFRREGNNFDGLAQIENPSHRRRRVRFTGVGTHERLSVPRRLSSPPPPYTLNWDPQTIQTLVAQLDNLQVQLQAALEMETEKHIKIHCVQPVPRPATGEARLGVATALGIALARRAPARRT